MQQRLPSRLDPPLAFAHRGARALVQENTIEAFELALRLGATGLESDVWITSDGVPVLDHDGVVGGRLRRRSIAQTRRDDLPEWIPTLAEFFEAVGDDFHLSLDVKDPEAFEATAEVVRERDNGATERTWLCDPDAERLIECRAEYADLRLVHSTRLKKLDRTPEQHAARLADAGIDAFNMHHTDWSGGLVVLVHRFDLFAFGWDLQHPHHLESALRMGLDAIYSDHVDTMMDAVHSETG